MNPFWHIRRFVLEIPFLIRKVIFRIKHGFPIEDCWALDDSTGAFLAPRLRYFAEHHTTIGHGVDDEVWTAILYKMADGFDIIASEDWDAEDRLSYCEECLDLFREYFFNLWD